MSKLVGKRININHFFGRLYHIEHYNCMHFTCEVWEHLTGENNLREILIKDGCINYERVKKFIVLEKPDNPCLVYFKTGIESHLGVFLNGRILHITHAGVRYEHMETLRVCFRKMRFFRCN